MIDVRVSWSDERLVRNRISLFCAAIPVLGIPLFLTLRNGFDEKYYIELVICSGLSFLLLFTPLYIGTFVKRSASLYFKSESLILLLSLFILCALAFIPYIAPLLSMIGFGCFGLSFYIFLVNCKSSWRTTLFMGITVCFALWALFTVWAVDRPTLFETLSVNRQVFQVQDLFYHCSIAQMIKNYGTPSTGLQGTPYVYYHFGSHWFFSQMSRLTNFHVVRIYNIFYPFVVVPVFFKVFLTFCQDLRIVLGRARRMSVLGVAIFFCLFVGIPHHLYAGGFFHGSTLGLESQLFSLLLLFNLGSLWLIGFKNGFDSKADRAQKLFVLVFSPLLLACIGLVKISTLFVALGILCALVIWFKRWKTYLGVGTIITIIISVIVYSFVVDTLPFGLRSNGHEGQMAVGNFYAQMKAERLFNPVHWFGWFFFWTYALIAVGIFYKIRSNTGNHETNSLIHLVFTSVVASIVGLLPSFLFSFNGINAIFFVSIQMYISGSFLIALAPELKEIVTGQKKMRVAFRVFCLGLIAAFFIKFGIAAKEILMENVNTRRILADRAPIARRDFSFFTDLNTIWSIRTGIQQKANENKLYQTLHNLERMGNVHDPDRSNTLIFITDYINGAPIPATESLNCLEKSFLIPALSGYSALNGAIYNCSIESYGAYYYNYPGATQDSSIVGVCNNVLSKNFQRVIYYNAVENTSKISYCAGH